MKVRTYDMIFCNSHNCDDKFSCERNIENYEMFGINKRVSFTTQKENNKEDCKIFLELEREV